MKNEILDNIIEKPKLNLAGFGSRLGAYLIDILPIVIIANVLIYLILGVNPFNTERQVIEIDGEVFQVSEIIKITVRYASFFIWIIYCAIMEASSFEGTFGKRMMGIKVSDEHGNQLTIGKSILRNSTKTLSYIVIGLGFIWVLFDKQKRGWHDMIAKTFVLKK